MLTPLTQFYFTVTNYIVYCTGRVQQVLKGLEYMHSKNFVHRDIKPENILLSANRVVKICDFGLCRKHWKADRTLDMSNNVGTLWYQAPEILNSSTKYDAMVDIWAVGTYLCVDRRRRILGFSFALHNITGRY